MHGELFKSLNKLIVARFLENQCINEDFENEIQIAILPKTVDTKCGLPQTTD